MQAPFSREDYVAEAEAFFGKHNIGNLSNYRIESCQNLLEAMIMGKAMIDDADVSRLSMWVTFPEKEIDLLCKQIYNIHSYETVLKYSIGPETILSDANDVMAYKSTLSSEMECIPASDGKAVDSLQSHLLCKEGFYHGFTTRKGGVSSYRTMKSLNMVNSTAKKDTLLFVQENRRRLANAHGFDPDFFEMAKAVHGSDVWVVGESKPESYDAIVTDKVGITIAAPGADCTTILFCDPINKAVGAAHSGWRGVLADISGNVLKTMKDKFGSRPQDILIALGPSLGPCCFEVDSSLAARFSTEVSDNVVNHPQQGSKPFVNLWESITTFLVKAGVQKENIDNRERQQRDGVVGVTQCTKCPENHDKFFSYRRDGKLFGNQCAFIGISKPVNA